MERVGSGPWDGNRYPSSTIPRVHTEVSDGYDKQAPTPPAVLPPDTAPTPTQRRGRKEDAMASKRGKGRLPYGKGRTTLVEIIASHAHKGQEFNATALYNWMSSEVQSAWRAAYGSRTQTISRISSFLADINTRTRFPMNKSENAPSTYIYTGGWVAGTQLKNIRPAKVATPVKTKPLSVNLSKTVKPIKALDNYTNVGFTLTNEPLFQHRDTKVVGTMVFAPLE